ncbi:MAG TPA: efflux RND transporter periplasmic adaptor subunit [Candidatus Saccharimonadales bacterium]|nr:efflux RND transporter periplasmic adaptor subunit [Candidatus Saccharimonadales bacterium]
MLRRMLLVLAAVAVFIGVVGFIKFKQIQTAIAAGRSYQAPPEAVTTVVAQVEPWESTLEAVGSLAPVQGVVLSADQPGIVDSIAFQSDARVEAGATLVLLDTRQERAQLAGAEAQLDLARINLDRSRKLLDQQMVAQADFDLAAAQAKQAEANVREIEATIARKTIRAPFAGVVGIRQVNLGQYLRSGDPVAPIQSLDPIYADFAVPQQQLASLRLGNRVQVTAGDETHAAVAGTITAINPVVDGDTRNVQVQATLPNPGGELRPGMYVDVTVALGAHSSAITLPLSAVNYAPYGNSVFVLDNMKAPDGHSYRGVREQFVTLGPKRGDQVAVLQGLKPGQEVVSSGVFKLRTGAAVLVNNKVQPSNSPAPKPEDS